MQRLRITFSRGETTKYITHLDMVRYWERAFRRAHLPLALTQGFRPHPRFALAAPLAVGVTSVGELMDLYLEPSLAADEVARRLQAQMVSGIAVLDVHEVALELPSMQADMRFAEYEVTMETELDGASVEAAIAELLGRSTFPWEHLRDSEVRRYDLRPHVDRLWLVRADPGQAVLGMRLKADSAAAGRPEQVAKALGFGEHPLVIHRTGLVLVEGVRKPGFARPPAAGGRSGRRMVASARPRESRNS